MSVPRPVAPVLFSLLLPLSTAARAEEGAHEWLMRISEAARSLDYEGVFVYQHGSQLEAMRIVHKRQEGRSHERLVSLNGAPREVIRNDRMVMCYLPDENSVVVEHRRIDNQNFPALLPERAQELAENYRAEVGRTGRIAGRKAQRIKIKPLDRYRYGYELWADVETGLLLKADLLDADGALIEQFMFTQIRIGADIPAAALVPETSAKNMVWHRDGNDTPAAMGNWQVGQLPKGFRLSTRVARNAPTRKMPVEHLVYSDGLAAVSVFIEKRAKGAAAAMRGEGRMGAVHAYGTQVGDYQVTVVGEVPAETVAMIGNSVTAER